MAERICLFLIGLYQKVRRSLPYPPVCRFYPSCSQYMKEAVIKYGFFKGFLKGALRLLKCHPYHKGGYDPVK
ncbi:MAG: membrane protein insertion efficiency factor YidD [bacterium]|nr:membrane protein insertion efficiency factor YidD [bacterium]